MDFVTGNINYAARSIFSGTGKEKTAPGEAVALKFPKAKNFANLAWDFEYSGFGEPSGYKGGRAKEDSAK